MKHVDIGLALKMVAGDLSKVGADREDGVQESTGVSRGGKARSFGCEEVAVFKFDLVVVKRDGVQCVDEHVPNIADEQQVFVGFGFQEAPHHPPQAVPNSKPR